MNDIKQKHEFAQENFQRKMKQKELNTNMNRYLTDWQFSAIWLVILKSK